MDPHSMRKDHRSKPTKALQFIPEMTKSLVEIHPRERARQKISEV